MRTPLLPLACFLALVSAPVATAWSAEKDARGREKQSQDTRAILVVTGLRQPAGATAAEGDWSAAAGAKVQLRKKGGKTEEKPTRPFQSTEGSKRGSGRHTADFWVDLDATYEITMTFPDGTAVRIDDYRLPKEWRTHFYFHSTRGTLSPASVLRRESDPATGLGCWAYAVFPLANYRALGGSQIE